MRFPLSPAQLAVELGMSEQMVVALRIEGGLPCAREVATGKWWLSHEGQLQAWRQYLDPPKPKPPPSTSGFLHFTDADSTVSAGPMSPRSSGR